MATEPDMKTVCGRMRALATSVGEHPEDAAAIHAALVGAGLAGSPPAGSQAAAAHYASVIEQLPAVAAKPEVAAAVKTLEAGAGMPGIHPDFEKAEIGLIIACVLFCI